MSTVTTRGAEASLHRASAAAGDAGGRDLPNGTSDSWVCCSASRLPSDHVEVADRLGLAAVASATGGPLMTPFRVAPTAMDVAISDQVASRTGPRVEHAAEAMTWGADEHVLCTLAVGWWLYSRTANRAARRAGDHILLTTLVATALPHLLKEVFDQERPDRLTIKGHLRGVPISGKPRDAFPSGHAVHVGAMASAASVLPPKQRNIVWAASAGLVSTRIVLLAHWASDVAAGLLVGVLIERSLRLLTGYGRPPR